MPSSFLRFLIKKLFAYTIKAPKIQTTNTETKDKIMKLEEKAYKSTLAVAGVVSIAAAALLGKKKKK